MSDHTAPAPTVWHTLRYRDAPAAIDFLQRAFGFVLVVRYDNADDPTQVDHAQLHWPEGGGIMLGSLRNTPEWPASAGQAAAYVVTADPATLLMRAKAAGATIVADLHEQDYGSTDFAATDPEGNLWSFGTYRGEPPP
jgi:uncharacterized glyoxalase superfamily protein PhnB